MRRSLSIMTNLLLFAVGPVFAQDDPVSSERVAFEPGAGQRALDVELLWGRVTVRPHDHSDVQFVVATDEPEDGLRSLLPPSGYEVSRSDGRVGFHAVDPGSGVFRALDVTVYVPAGLDIRIAMRRGGDVFVDGVEASLEISNYNGSVQLKKVAGDAQVDARNGEIDARFSAVPAGRVLVFATLNGGVTVTLPADHRADLHAVAGTDDIRTDFDVEIAEQGDGSEIMRGPARGTLTRVVKGRINGGGPLLYVQTHNGPVRILKGESHVD